MSRIYDALVQAAKNRDSRTTTFQSSADQKAGLLSSRGISLEWKIMGTVATVLLVFGLFLVIIASHLMGRALRSEIDQRALAITTNLSNAATSHVIGKNILELYVLLTKYAQLQGVAYAFIEDNNGQVVSHSLKPSPPELMGTLTSDQRKQVGTRVVTLQGKTVYETRVPILEGQLGAAHLGIWADGVNGEISTARLPFVSLVVAALLVAIALSVFLVRVIIPPIGDLTGSATEVSANELKAPIEKRAAR